MPCTHKSCKRQRKKLHCGGFGAFKILLHDIIEVERTFTEHESIKATRRANTKNDIDDGDDDDKQVESEFSDEDEVEYEEDVVEEDSASDTEQNDNTVRTSRKFVEES